VINREELVRKKWSRSRRKNQNRPVALHITRTLWQRVNNALNTALYISDGAQFQIRTDNNDDGRPADFTRAIRDFLFLFNNDPRPRYVGMVIVDRPGWNEPVVFAGAEPHEYHNGTHRSGSQSAAARPRVTLSRCRRPCGLRYLYLLPCVRFTSTGTPRPEIRSPTTRWLARKYAVQTRYRLRKPPLVQRCRRGVGEIVKRPYPVSFTHDAQTAVVV